MTLDPEIAPGDAGTAERRALRRLARLLVAGALLGAACGYAISFALAPRWQAIASLRPGQVGVPAPGASPNGLEPLGTVYERLNSPGFGQDVSAALAAAGKPLAGPASIQALVVDSAGIVRVRVQAGSRDDATRFLDAAIARIVAGHDEVYRPAVAQLEGWRTTLASELDLVSARRARLAAALTGGAERAPRDDRLAQALLELRDAEVLSLTERIARIEASMSPLVTFPTGPVERSWAPPDPYHPNRAVTAVMGAMAGAALAALAAFLVPPRR